MARMSHMGGKRESMTTEKQIKANRENAKKSTGPTTTEGKELSRMNGVKHAIMAEALVVDRGDGKESEEAFNGLVSGLTAYFQPVGTMEDALVEQIAIAIWRRRRVLRYETGCIRDNLDSFKLEYRQRDSYGDKTALQKLSKVKSVRQRHLDSIAYLRENPDEDQSSADFFEAWSGNLQKIAEGRNWDTGEPWQVLEWLQEEGLSKNQILAEIIKIDEEGAKKAEEEIRFLEGLVDLELQREALKGCLPNTMDLEKIIRYEAALDRQTFKAINQLERLQRGRKGETLPPPVVIDGI